MATQDLNRYQAILDLRAIRSYDSEPPSDEDVMQVLEAARWTGSSKNRQLWSFVVITDAAQKDRLVTAGDFTIPLQKAPIGIAIVQEDEGYEFDSGRVAQNIMLAADALGLVTCPITLHREEIAHEVLGLPEAARCRYAIALGRPGANAKAAPMGGRKPMDEVIHRNTYGQ